MSVPMQRWEDAAEFWKQYRFLSRALALRRSLRWGAWLMALGLAATLLAVPAWRVLGRELPPLPLVLAPALALGLVGLLAGYLRRERPERAVRLADTQLGLKERLTTALELVRGGPPTPIARVQVHDAVSRFSAFSPMEAFPARVPPRAANLVFILLGLVLVAAFVPLPFRVTSPGASADREVAREEAARLSQLDEALSREEQTAETVEIRRLLAEAQRALEDDKQTPEQALATLTDLEERIYRMGDGDRQGLEAALAALSASLASTPGQEDLAKRLATSDLKQVSRDLRRLGQEQGQMAPAQRAEFGRALQAAAQNAARSNQQFARSLQAAADAMAQGQTDPQGAQRAMNELASQAQSAANRDRALSQAQASRSNVARSGENAPQQGLAQAGSNGGLPRAGSRGSQQQGQGSSQADSSMPGAQQGQGSTGQAGSQSGQGDTSSSSGASEPDGTQGGSGAGQGDGGDSSKDGQIYDPTFGTRPEQVSGQDQFQPSEVSSDPYLSQAQQNGARVGYRDVYGQYQDRAVRNIEQSYVPLGLKDLVRQYFDELDPNK